VQFFQKTQTDSRGTHRLKVLGLKSLDELEQKVVPQRIRGSGEELSALPEEVLSEADALKEITELAKMNKVLKSFIGMGYVGFHSCGPFQATIVYLAH